MTAGTPSPYPEIKLLIGGHWRTASEYRAVINPADETEVGRVPLASPADLLDAVQAAEEGLRLWRRTAPAARAQVLLQAARLLRERIADVARAVVLEQGKTLWGAQSEVARACSMLEWDANEGCRLYGRVISVDSQSQTTALREPVGVVAAFAPWNAPFASPMRKVAGALAAGCSLILKPAEETPAGAWFIAQALQDAGLPAGVLNLVYGRPEEVSRTLVSHPAVRMVTFTGSVPVGRRLAILAGQHLKPALMELGGHAPVLVCSDADPQATGVLAVQAKSVNTGQICVSPTRFFVETPLADTFARAFAEGASALRIGPGLDPRTQMGPLSNRRRVDAIDELVADARQRGARVLCGGVRPSGPGHFYPLTVLADVPDGARVLVEEPFGPLALVNRVDSLEEGLARANALPFGLAAYAFTDSSRKAAAFTAGIEAGALAINHFSVSSAETPFGGVKDSGYGREGGVEGLEAYTVIKSVSQRIT